MRTNTPLQALTTLNDEAFFEAARALAARVLRETPPGPSAAAALGGPSQRAANERRATYGFRLVLTRTPRQDEIARILASYTRQLERFRKAPDFAARTITRYAVDGVDPAEQAAWTLVANALLNLDEALTRP